MAAARDDLQILNSALEAYRADYGFVPTAQQGLNALIQAPAGATSWHGPYYAGLIPKDPWQHDFIYRSPGANGAHYDLLSCGPNGKEGDGDDVR